MAEPDGGGELRRRALLSDRSLHGVCTHAYDLHMPKTRVTVTLDAETADAARELSSGEESLSAWVAAAVADRVERERKLAALREVIAEYEAEHGEITQAEIEAQRRADRENAVVVRGVRGE